MSTSLHMPPAGKEAASREANRFAFVLHPLTVDYLAKHPRYSWTRHLPRTLVEASAAHMPASHVGSSLQLSMSKVNENHMKEVDFFSNLPHK